MEAWRKDGTEEKAFQLSCQHVLASQPVALLALSLIHIFFTAAAGTRIVPPYFFALAYGFAGRIRAVGAAAGGGGLGSGTTEIQPFAHFCIDITFHLPLCQSCVFFIAKKII